MKKIFYSIAVILMSLQLTSCKLYDSRKDSVNIVEEGYVVYMNATNQVLYPVLQSVNIALVVDYYLNAASDSIRYEIEDSYFRGNGLRVRGDYITVSDGLFSITKDSLSLCEQGAEWISEKDGIVVKVINTGVCQWDVNVDLSKSVFWGLYDVEEITMSVSALNNNGVLELDDDGFIFEVTTSGKYREISNVNNKRTVAEVTFETVDTPKLVGRDRYSMNFYAGSFLLHLETNEPVTRSEDIKVTLSQSIYNTRTSVEYMGQTYIW